MKDSFAIVSMSSSLYAICYCFAGTGISWEEKSSCSTIRHDLRSSHKRKKKKKDAKLDPGTLKKPSNVVKILGVDPGKFSDSVTTSNSDTNEPQDVGIVGLVSYNDEGEDNC